jgi:hypothetical protein
MQYYPPSIPAIECSPLVPENATILVCPSCGDTMKHLRTIPKLAAFGTVHLRLPFLRRGRYKEAKQDVRVPHDGRLDLQETLDEDGAPVALH